MRANVEHNHVLHERVVIFSWQAVNVPHVPIPSGPASTVSAMPTTGNTHVTARLGFKDDPEIPAALLLTCAHGLDCDLETDAPTYLLSRIRLGAIDAPGMSRWRKRLFVAIAHNAASPVEYLCLRDDRTVTMGSTIQLSPRAA